MPGAESSFETQDWSKSGKNQTPHSSSTLQFYTTELGKTRIGMV